MWSAEKDVLETSRRQRSHLSTLSIRSTRSLFQETALDKEPVCNEPRTLVAPYLPKRRRAALRQMCTSREPISGKPRAHATCVAGRGTPSSSSPSDINCPLAALMTTWCSLQELPLKPLRKPSLKAAPREPPLALFFFFFFLKHIELFYHRSGSSAILGRLIMCLKITQRFNV